MKTRFSPDQRRGWRFDAVLRLAGLAALAASAEAIHFLASGHGVTPLAFACAAVAFLGATSGSALLLLGHHLFDRIEVSQRWSRQPPARLDATSRDAGIRRKPLPLATPAAGSPPAEG